MLIRILPANAVLTTILADTVFMYGYQCILTERCMCACSVGLDIYDLLFECIAIHCWLFVTLLTYITRIPFRGIKKIQDFKIRRGLCGHSVSFQMYMLVENFDVKYILFLLFQYPYRLGVSC